MRIGSPRLGKFLQVGPGLHCTCAELGSLQSGKQLRAEQGRVVLAGGDLYCRVLQTAGYLGCVGCRIGPATVWLPHVYSDIFQRG